MIEDLAGVSDELANNLDFNILGPAAARRAPPASSATSAPGCGTFQGMTGGLSRQPRDRTPTT